MSFDPFEQFKMNGLIALVTGGAQNIGEAIARTFAGAVAQVMVADLDGDKALMTAQRIADGTGQKVLGTKCDVTDKRQVKEYWISDHRHDSRR